MRSKPWQDIAAHVQARRDATIAQIIPAIPRVAKDLPTNVTEIPKRLLDSSEVRITEMLPEELLKELSIGKLSSEEVTNAFLRRAGLAQRLVNCVTEVMVTEALERARYCDDYLANYKKPIGPLHGLPISVKEHIMIKDKTINCGFVAWSDRIAPNNANILTLLRNAGAVFYARTTEPQTIMHLETSSNLYGVTVNPYNRSLTSGGSSGGEGALLALRGSCLGIGTDIGGSIRSPAANCGVWGFRSTSYRLPYVGAAGPGQGEEQIIGVIGPLSTSLAGLSIFTKALVNQKPWLVEPSLVPLAWNDSISHLSRRHGRAHVKIGILWDDGVVRPHPPITRSLMEMAAQLRNLPGFEIVDWMPLRHDEGWEIISSLYFPDAGKENYELLEQGDEPILPLTRFILEQSTVPEREDTATKIWEKTVRREAFRAEYAAHWNETGEQDGHCVDIILCPVGPGVAPPLGHARYWPYTSTWNLLDYPAMVFPYGFVDQVKDQVEKNYKPRNAQDTYNYNMYDPKKFVDAPIGLQLVGRRYEDEKVFEIMKLIRASINM